MPGANRRPAFLFSVFIPCSKSDSTIRLPLLLKLRRPVCHNRQGSILLLARSGVNQKTLAVAIYVVVPTLTWKCKAEQWVGRQHAKILRRLAYLHRNDGPVVSNVEKLLAVAAPMWRISSSGRYCDPPTWTRKSGGVDLPADIVAKGQPMSIR